MTFLDIGAAHRRSMLLSVANNYFRLGCLYRPLKGSPKVDGGSFIRLSHWLVIRDHYGKWHVTHSRPNAYPNFRR